MDIAKLESETLSLPVEARASLAQKLLISLEEVTDSECDLLWSEESVRRLADLDAGRVGAVSAEEVACKARSLLR